MTHERAIAQIKAYAEKIQEMVGFINASNKNLTESIEEAAAQIIDNCDSPPAEDED